jgi:hypothetical protein
MHWALLKGAGSSDRDVEIAAPCSASSRLQRGGLTNENPQAALFIRELTDGLEQAANVWRTQSSHGIPPLRTAGKVTHTHRRPAMIAQRRATRIRRRAHRRQREACAEADLMSVMQRRGVSPHNKLTQQAGREQYAQVTLQSPRSSSNCMSVPPTRSQTDTCCRPASHRRSTRAWSPPGGRARG